MFKFVKIKAHDNKDYWYLLLDTKESFDLFIKQRSNDLVKSYMHIKELYAKNPMLARDGHFDTPDENVISFLLHLKDETEPRKTIVDDCKVLDSLLNGYHHMFTIYGTILINKNNGCQTLDKDMNILETRIREGILFPSEAIEEKDIKVSQWVGGKHWYVRVGGYDLPDKYFSYEKGFEAGKKYLEAKKEQNVL